MFHKLHGHCCTFLRFGVDSCVIGVHGSFSFILRLFSILKSPGLCIWSGRPPERGLGALVDVIIKLCYNEDSVCPGCDSAGTGK